MTYDVAVIGVGAMGSAALWRVAARGARAIGFERFEPGHDLGSSHGESRIIRSAYYEGPEYVPLVLEAFALWRELERASGASLLTMTGALMIGAPERNLVAGALASARAHSLAHEVLDTAAVAARFPQFQIASDEVALYEEQAGILRPEEAIRQMARLAREAGAELRTRCTVTAIEPQGDGVRVLADGESYHARRAIVAVGAWLPTFLPGWPMELEVERQVFVWLPARDAALFKPTRFPVFMHEIAPDRFRYGIPSFDGSTVKVGIHHEGQTTSAEAIEREVHERDVAPVLRYAARHLPDLEPRAARTAVCMYTNAPDGHFIVGPAAGMPAVTVISACSGHGFKYAPVLGDAAADLALAGGTGHPIASFAPGRFSAGVA